MKIKIAWIITIVSWLMFIMYIILPFTGVIKREWDGMIVWVTALSTTWTTILVNELKEKKNND